MARIAALDVGLHGIKKDLSRALQSGHINFFIGSGASHPAIRPAGDIEAKIDAHRQADETAQADALLFQLIASVQEPAAGAPADDDTAERVPPSAQLVIIV